MVSPRKRAFRGASLLLAVLLLISLSGVGGYYVGRRQSGVAPANVLSATNPNGEKINLTSFWQAWNDLTNNYVGTTDTDKRVDGAISGMAASLGDPYTVYLPKSASDTFQSDLQGSFGGIGAELEVKNGLLTVIDALDGTPADKGGIKSGDVIMKIDGKTTEGMNFNDAIAKIRGTSGTKVDLTIARQGVADSFVVSLTRDTVVVKSVKTDTIGDNKNIAYIKVNQFGADTAGLFKTALQDAVSTGKKGAVIDLRNDPGGYLDAAVSMIGMVVPDSVSSDQQKLRDRVAVQEKDKAGKETDQKTNTPSVAPTLPLVILVNGGSASASEIFAGAMKDYGRAKVIGTQTFGKGSVQTLLSLDNGGSIKVTIAKWFTPLGTGIDGKGIEPDVKVAIPSDATLSATDVQVSHALTLLPS